MQAATGGSITSLGHALLAGGTVSNVTTNPAGIILLSLAALAAVVMVWAALMVRKVLIVVSAVFAPIAFAGSLADITTAWVRRWIEVTAALIFSKLILVLIFLVGWGMLAKGVGQAGQSGPQTTTQAVSGLLVLALAGFAPWLALKMVHWTGDQFHHLHTMAATSTAGAQKVMAAPQKVRPLAMAAMGAAGGAAAAGAGGGARPQRAGRQRSRGQGGPPAAPGPAPAKRDPAPEAGPAPGLRCWRYRALIGTGAGTAAPAPAAPAAGGGRPAERPPGRWSRSRWRPPRPARRVAPPMRTDPAARPAGPSSPALTAPPPRRPDDSSGPAGAGRPACAWPARAPTWVLSERELEPAVTVAPESGTVRFGRRPTRGLLLGFSAPRVLVLGLAAAVAVAGLVAANGTGFVLSAVLWGPLVASAFVRVGGRPVIEWAPTAAQFGGRRTTGQTEFRAPVTTAPTGRHPGPRRGRGQPRASIWIPTPGRP